MSLATPRSILKRHPPPLPSPPPPSSSSSTTTTTTSSSRPPHQSDARKVHFPPSRLVRVGFAHSPESYDRSPIIVLPNSCALPERGCPGRTYYGHDDDVAALLSASRSITPSCQPALGNNGKSFHPRAPSLTKQSSPYPSLMLPDLILDSTSESESDGFCSTPPEYADTCITHDPTIMHDVVKEMHGLPLGRSVTNHRRFRKQSSFKTASSGSSLNKVAGCLGGF